MPRDSLLWLIAGTVIPSFIVTCVATYFMRWLSPRVGLVDKPNARKVHLTPVPLGGGVGIACGVLAPLAVGSCLLLSIDPAVSEDASLAPAWLPKFAATYVVGLQTRVPGLWVMLGCATVLMLLGLIDDKRGLDWRVRMGVQFAVAAYCAVVQDWRLTAFIDIPQLGWAVSVALSMIWIVALINSFNMLDNMDALSSGVAAITSSVLAALMLIFPDPQTGRPQLFVAGLLLLLVGSLCGFLCHNRPPARIFMGDAGSYFIGFVIAIATLLATYAGYSGTASPHAVVAPLCVMAVPLYDMISVIWIRLREGRSPFQADKNHFSHRLVELGLTKTQAVLTIYLTTATCGLCALLLPQVNLLGALVLVLVVMCVLLLIAILESSARRKLKQ